MTIKEARMKHGLTQTELSQITGIPFRTIQNWEGGQRKCPEYVERLVLDLLDRKFNTTVDLTRLIHYLLEHEDKDISLMQNAGMNEYPSTVLKKLLK